MNPKPLPSAHADTPLPSPRELETALPMTPAARRTVREGRQSLRDLLRGEDTRRLAVIVGPCSIHDPEEALEYGGRLGRLAESLSGELLVVMRTFFEKPRTGLGWKGLVPDPHLDGSNRLEDGLHAARRLLVELNEGGLPCATEILGAFTVPYLADGLVWGGIGARTCESAVHREIASGLPFPVGFKNGMDGSLDGATHGIRFARARHQLITIGAEGRVVTRETLGNPDAHLVLRGGRSGPNFDTDSLERALAALGPAQAERPLVIDASHGNSGKDARRQASVVRGVLGHLREGRPGIAGVMLESYLEPGQQPLGPRDSLRSGVSITDACIGWNETADLLCELGEGVKLSR